MKDDCIQKGVNDLRIYCDSTLREYAAAVWMCRRNITGGGSIMIREKEKTTTIGKLDRIKMISAEHNLAKADTERVISPEDWNVSERK